MPASHLGGGKIGHRYSDTHLVTSQVLLFLEVSGFWTFLGVTIFTWPYPNHHTEKARHSPCDTGAFRCMNVLRGPF